MMYRVQHMHDKRLGNTFVELGQFLRRRIYNGNLVLIDVENCCFLGEIWGVNQVILKENHLTEGSMLSLKWRFIAFYYGTALLSKN